MAEQIGRPGGIIPGFKGTPGEKYRPSNGTEGDFFMDRFCWHCERDRAWREQRGDSCDILCRSLVFDVDEADYPSEWTYDEQGRPICTAYIAEMSDGKA